MPRIKRHPLLEETSTAEEQDEDTPLGVEEGILSGAEEDVDVDEAVVVDLSERLCHIIDRHPCEIELPFESASE